MNTIAKLSIAALLLLSACKGNDNENHTDTETAIHPVQTNSSSATSIAPVVSQEDTLLGKKQITKAGKTIHTQITKPDGYTITVTEVELPYYISGKIEGGAGGTVIIDEMRIGSYKPLFSQTINEDGLYDFEGEVSEPTLMQLRLPAGSIHLIVYPGDTITLASKLAHPEKFTSGGSVETERLRDMYLILEAANAKKDVVTNEIEGEKDVNKLRKLYSLQPVRMHAIDVEKRRNLEKFIDKVDTSFVAVLAAMYLDPIENFAYIQKVVKKFQYKWPNSLYYNSLYKKYMAYLPVQLGHTAPEILSTTPKGDELRLSGLKGKYVLVDFWASWCEPCKKQFPDLISLYNKYKSKNFEILGVSADEKKDLWIKGIAENNLPWLQVSDLTGYKSGNLQTYRISSLPNNYLIGPDGKILEKNMDIVTLREKLAKYIK